MDETQEEADEWTNLREDDETEEDANSDDIEVDERIERTDTGVSLEIEMKRGTGTRDQEKITGKAKRGTVEEAIDDAEELKAYMKETAQELRDFNPTREDKGQE